VLVLGTRGVAGLMRQMRGNLLDVLSENFILAARARGLAERKVLYKHAVRNSINPLITLFGYDSADFWPVPH
jgi:peptide/nickel transport system permease protein